MSVASPRQPKPRILLLLTRRSYRAEAFLAAARHRGVDVVVGTNHRAALQDFAPERNLTLDLDRPRAAVAKIEDAARSLPIDAVIAAEDEGTYVAALASEALGLRHASPQSVRTARDKAALRQSMADSGLPVPWFTVIRSDEAPGDAAQRVQLPCVVKPLSLSASRGVIRADDPEALVQAIERSRTIVRKARRGVKPTLLIEAFLPGREVALEGVLVNGGLITFAILDKPEPMDGPFFEETLLIAPSRLPDEVQRAITTQVGAVAAAIGLREGPVHAELRVDGTRVRLLELAPRSIGGRCSAMLRFADGATLEDVIMQYALQRVPVAPPLELGASGVMMLPIPGPGVLRGVEGQARARMVPFIDELEITAALGAEMEPPPEGSTYLGFLFARAPSAQQVERALRTAHGHLVVKIDPQAPPAPNLP